MSNANHIQHTGAASSNPFLAIAAAYGDYTKKSFEDTKLFVEKLCGAKSLKNAIEVQTEFAKTAYETFVTESQTIGVLYGDLAKQSYKPFGGFAAKITRQIDKFTSRCQSTIALLIASLFRIITQYGCRAMIALTSSSLV